MVGKQPHAMWWGGTDCEVANTLKNTLQMPFNVTWIKKNRVLLATLGKFSIRKLIPHFLWIIPSISFQKIVLRPAVSVLQLSIFFVQSFLICKWDRASVRAYVYFCIVVRVFDHAVEHGVTWCSRILQTRRTAKSWETLLLLTCFMMWF